MKNFGIALLILAGIGLVVFGWYKNGYNTVIALDEQVKSSWAQVENQLQRRFDLIPNLVNTVKGYAGHEKSLLTEVTELRSRWSAAPTVNEKVESANQLTSALSRLIAVSENYPDLKANQNFLTLQSQLEGTENRIAVERMRYNQSVQAFNSYLRSMFGRFFAVAAGITQPAVYFKADENAKSVPQVSF
jgi:LemA protein